MNDEKRFIEGIWKKIEERERDLKILDGLEQRNENNMLLVAKEFLGRMGIRGLFCGITDVVAVSLVISVCIVVGIFFYLGWEPQYIYSMVFTFAPTLYTSIFCLSYVKETQINTINVQMSCRYTFFHVLVFRMVLNSGLAMVFNLIYICTLNHWFDINPVKALALSFSSLMLFSVMLLQSLRRINKLLGFAEINIVWFGVNLLAFNTVRDFYIRIIDQIPFSVLILAAFLFSAFYYRELKKLININYKRRYINA